MSKKRDWNVTPAKQTRKWMVDDDLDIICRAFENYEGAAEVIEGAIGALLIGRLVGYNGLRVVHSWRTLKKYEGILGIEFGKLLPEKTEDTDRINGIRYARKFKAFWKALAAGVSSEEGARDLAGRGSAVAE